MKTKKKFTTSQLTVLGLMSGVLLLMAYTPLGYLNIGPLAISFNVIPVAVSAVVLGPAGGAVAGAIFGQCIGIGGTSAMGAVLFGISPVLAFLQRFIPRLLMGVCVGYIFRTVRKKANIYVSCAVTGFFSAFLNTVFFMTALVGMFGNTEYIRELIGGQNVLLFCCAFVGINAVCEMAASTVITGAVGTALSRARLIPASQIAVKQSI